MANPVSSIIKNYSLNERTVHFFMLRLCNINTYMSKWPEGSVAADNFSTFVAALKTIHFDDLAEENNHLTTMYHPLSSRVNAILGKLVKIELSG